MSTTKFKKSKLELELETKYNEYNEATELSKRIETSRLLVKSLYAYLEEKRFKISLLNTTDITYLKLINNELINIGLIQDIAATYIKNKQTDSEHAEYLEINNELYDYLIKSIIYYYEYYYYVLIIPYYGGTLNTLIDICIEDYKSYYKKHNISYSYDDLYLKSFFQQKKSNYSISSLFFNKSKPKHTYYLFYRFILFKFNDFINLNKIKNEDFTESFIGKLIGDKTILFQNDKSDEKDEEKKEIKKKIIDFINIIKQIYIKFINYGELITLPQYEGICWFIAFLSCICYSDKSKELFINKFDYIETNKNIIDLNEFVKLENLSSIKETPQQILISLIYYIISNITIDYKKYEKKTDNCKLYLILKKIPILFLSHLYNTHFDSIPLIESTYYLNKIVNPDNISIKNKDLYLFYLYDNYVNYNKEKTNNLNNLNNHGANILYILALYKYLYNLTNISCDCLLVINTKAKILNKLNDDNPNPNPDVLLIEILDKKNKYYKNSYTNIINDELLKSIGKKNIKYNDYTYVLDYRLYYNNTEIESNKYGHIISCIKYDNEEYYHDQSYTVYKVNCDSGSESINIPCPLIKKKWIDIKEDETHFCLKKCYYKTLNLNDNISDSTLGATRDELCYKPTSGIIYGYVKK